MTTTSTALRTRLKEFRERHGVPALGAGIVTPEGLPELEVVGERVRGGGEPARLDDRWHVGSCGKSITAALYARLVERGDAGWGAPLTSLFPDMVGRIDPGWARITIDDVFVCQAGLPANLTRAQMRAAWKDTRALPEQRTEITARALASAPRKPGRFLYSNLGYTLAGAAIERITRMPFEAALRSQLFEPLGMTSAGFGPPPALWGHGGRVLALGHVGAIDLGWSTPRDPADVRSDNPGVMSPAGRVHLTLPDWARFHRVFLTDGGGFLSPASVRRLTTPAAGRGRRMSPGWGMVPLKTGASLAQQGSNTFWVATAVVDGPRERTVMLVTNEGRPKLLTRTLFLALEILASERR